MTVQPGPLIAVPSLPEGWFPLPAAGSERRGLLRRDTFDETARRMVAASTVTKPLARSASLYLRRLAEGARDALFLAARIDALEAKALILTDLLVVGPVVLDMRHDDDTALEVLARAPVLKMKGAESDFSVERRHLIVGPAVRVEWTDERRASPTRHISYGAYVPALQRGLSIFGSVSPASGDVALRLAEVDAVAASLSLRS